MDGVQADVGSHCARRRGWCNCQGQKDASPSRTSCGGSFSVASVALSKLCEDGDHMFVTSSIPRPLSNEVLSSCPQVQDF